MKIQINNAEILDLTIQDMYNCWLIDNKSFHHWLTRKSNIKIPPEADTNRCLKPLGQDSMTPRRFELR